MQDQKDTVTGEQAADLAALQSAVAEQEAAPGAVVEQAQPAAPKIELADELRGLITVVVQTLGPMFPSLKEIYTEQATEAAATAIAGVCTKHGWLQGGMFGEYGEEIACVAVCGPLALATFNGVKGDLAKHKAKAAAKELKPVPEMFTAEKPSEAAPASKTVTFGAPT